MGLALYSGIWITLAIKGNPFLDVLGGLLVILLLTLLYTELKRSK